ncbi:hypothetical protein ACIGZJ_01385 [Kitasatospora sp. NPDC052868]|uniref:hypothetical protein n=1 Tax=Kitasatospora sp. NPDC052868 TaxID=3364060 RepID=UPI0037C5919F
MNREVFPYRRPRGGDVSADGWLVRLDGDGRGPLPSSIPDWDYQYDLRLEREVRIDVDAVRQSTGLPDAARLAVAVVWSSSGSGLRVRAHHCVLPVGGVVTVPIALTVRGRESGGMLALETQLVLASRLDDADPLTARRAGSLLWRDETQVRLEGDDSQFPMSVLDFKEAGYPEDAPWLLMVGQDVASAAMGALVLLVNSRTPLVLEAMKRAGRPAAADRLIHSAVQADVTRLLVEHAIRNPEIQDDARFEPDTLGHLLLGTVHTRLPGMSMRGLRELHEGDPSLFSARLQSAVQLFAKES